MIIHMCEIKLMFEKCAISDIITGYELRSIRSGMYIQLNCEGQATLSSCNISLTPCSTTVYMGCNGR